MDREDAAKDDGMGSENDLGWDVGSGGVMWKAAYVLEGVLSKEPAIVRGKSVLELGSGIGLCGIAAHKLGAASVELTDYVEEIVNKLTRSAAAAADEGIGGGQISASILDWDEEASMEDGDAAQQYELVIGSDIIYEVEQCEVLAPVIARRLIQSPDARAVLLMGIRGTMWQMMDHGSPLHLLNAFCDGCMQSKLDAVSIPVESSEAAEITAEKVRAAVALDETLLQNPPTIPAVEENFIAIVIWHKSYSPAGFQTSSSHGI